MNDTLTCKESRQFFMGDRVICQRPNNHKGPHQAQKSPNQYARWTSTGGAMQSGSFSLDSIGADRIPNCSECSVRLIETDKRTAPLCGGCQFWQEKVDDTVTPYMIIDGQCYLWVNNHLGFGGARFATETLDSKDLRENFSSQSFKPEWSVFTQGPVPEHFQDRLPNTHQWVSKEELQARGYSV